MELNICDYTTPSHSFKHNNIVKTVFKLPAERLKVWKLQDILILAEINKFLFTSQPALP